MSKKKTSLLSIVLFSFYYIFLLSEIFDTTLPILCSSLKLYFFVDDILHKTNISWYFFGFIVQKGGKGTINDKK